VSRALRLTRDEVRRFAEASGDRNPLHVDEAYARATPFGRCIAHGALVGIAALGALDRESLQRIGSIQARFLQPVFPDDEYAVSVARAEGDTAELEVRGRGRLAATIVIARGEAVVPKVSYGETDLSLPAPAVHALDEPGLSELSVEAPYEPDLRALRALADELGAGEVPDALLLWLAGASFVVGMLVPGRDALFATARVEPRTSERSGAVDASVTGADDRTGLVAVESFLHHGRASASMTLSTFLRAPVRPPSRATLARYLGPTDALAGRAVLVVGGSRGLGAALGGAFATQGASVTVAFARSRSHAEALEAEFGVRPLQFDAEDPRQARGALAALRTDVGELDGVVFCAAPPLYETALEPAATEAALEFVRSSLSLVLVPLAEVLPVLARDAWLVFVSSSELASPAEGWPHYTIAKSALEGVATYCRQHVRPQVLIARAPKMLTDSTNTPLGRLRAVPPEQVAAGVVRWATSDAATRAGLLAGDELLVEPIDPPGA